jgi:F0F1-type ATP synthase membrane subunit b/b'
MFAPFYFVFIPVVVAVAVMVWVLFFRIANDPQSDLQKRSRGSIQSDLEKAQELERQEAEAELNTTSGRHA